MAKMSKRPLFETFFEPLCFVVPGRPVLKSNYKARNRGGAHFNIASDYESVVAKHVKAQLRETYNISERELPLAPRPNKAGLALLISVKSNAGDATNYPKSICDALNGVIYEDDSQIRMIDIIKLTGPDYVPISGGDGVVILVSTPGEIAKQLDEWREMVIRMESESDEQ